MTPERLEEIRRTAGPDPLVAELVAAVDEARELAGEATELAGKATTKLLATLPGVREVPGFGLIRVAAVSSVSELDCEPSLLPPAFAAVIEQLEGKGYREAVRLLRRGEDAARAMADAWQAGRLRDGSIVQREASKALFRATEALGHGRDLTPGLGGDHLWVMLRDAVVMLELAAAGAILPTPPAPKAQPARPPRQLPCDSGWDEPSVWNGQGPGILWGSP